MKTFPTISRARLWQMVTSGTASVGVSVVATNILRIVSSMTLTRLLSSYDYGVVGVIMSVSFMINMLSDVGLAPFVIRHAEGNDRAFLNQLWTIRLIRGILLSFAMAVIAHPMAVFLGKPELRPVIAAWGLIFTFEGLQSMASITGIRQKTLWRLSLLDLIGNVATFVVSLVMALVLHSYWAIVIGMLSGAIVGILVSYTLFAQARRRWAFSPPRMRELWGFSRYLALASVLSLLIMESDKVVLARLLPLPVFGLYAIAVTLATAPVALVQTYTSRVLYPVFAGAAQATRTVLRSVFYDSRHKVVLLYMFGTGGVIGGAPLIIGLLYDPRYVGVVPFLRLITISAVLRMPSLAANELLIAIGRTRANLHANIGRIVWLAIGGAIGLVTGNIMLLVAIVGTVELPGLLCNWAYLRREGLFDLREESYGFLAAAAGVGIGYVVSRVVLALVPHL